MRQFLEGRGPVTKVIQSTLILMFDVSGTASGAKSKSVGLVWEALEYAGIGELELTSLKLVPAAEMTRESARRQTPASFQSGSIIASELSALRREISHSSTPLENLDEFLKVDESIASCFGEETRSSKDFVYRRDYEAVSSRHPGLKKHRAFLSWAVGVALSDQIETKSPEEIAEWAIDMTLSHIFAEVITGKGSVIGATEAAPILGVSIERMRQIAHEEQKSPIPFAWVGGKRPVWLREDVEAESFARIASKMTSSHTSVDSGDLPTSDETREILQSKVQFDRD